MRDAHVVMPPSLRDSVSEYQRHSVTEFRLNAGVETIGDRIRRLRTLQGMSRAALGQAVGLAPSTIADLENGYQHTTTKLHRFAEALGVPTEYLETGKGDLGPPAGPQALTRREQALLSAYRHATRDGKLAIEGAAAGVAGPFKQPQKPTLHRTTRGS